MTGVRRITELKRDDLPFKIRLADGENSPLILVVLSGSTHQHTGEITSLCLMPPKIKNIAFLSPLLPEFQFLKIWMCSADRTKARKIDYSTFLSPLSTSRCEMWARLLRGAKSEIGIIRRRRAEILD